MKFEVFFTIKDMIEDQLPFNIDRKCNKIFNFLKIKLSSSYHNYYFMSIEIVAFHAVKNKEIDKS